jgi:hypothetical protein
MGLQYKIVYKKEAENRVVDALSRSHDLGQLCLISSAAPQWLSSVQSSYDPDPIAQDLLSKLVMNSTIVPHFVLKDGILRNKSRIWVGQDSALHRQLISTLHDAPVGGHSGFLVTYSRVKRLFAWRGIKNDVKCFVQQCQVCLQSKTDRASYPGKLQPLPVPSEAWEIISLDFIEGLPHSANASCILVVVDKFTKFAHLLPLHHPYTDSSVASVFMDVVYKLHGLPASIISDHDPVFTSKFWQSLCGIPPLSRDGQPN